MKLLLIIFFIAPSLVFSQGLVLNEHAEKISSVLEENYVSWLDESIVFDAFRIRMILEYGIQIPVLGQLRVKPEVELFFVRQKLLEVGATTANE